MSSSKMAKLKIRKLARNHGSAQPANRLEQNRNSRIRVKQVARLKLLITGTCHRVKRDDDI